MPDRYAPTEFGGKVQRNRVQPLVKPDGTAGHTPTASEKLMLVYTTADDTGKTQPLSGVDETAAFEGLLPYAEQADKAIANRPVR